MRFAGQAQLGYYPTPPAIAHALAQACRPSDPVKPWTVCDPFCGPGDALHAFTTPHRYGIELDDGRAAQALATEATILSGNAFEAQIALHSLSALFLNPPYDYDPIRHIRYEALALHQFLPALKPHGLVLLIFPRSSWSAVCEACIALPLPWASGAFPIPTTTPFSKWCSSHTNWGYGTISTRRIPCIATCAISLSSTVLGLSPCRPCPCPPRSP